ncbi:MULTISPECIES: hypothetical protein [unclassified Solwaraspora]|uniref:hypothetical protein n=1 Tax=unclassified Solwaraspora TaxID=2627926 RepID=UPI00259AFDFA|nr:hypothetical protein [Solwaraspora sp. WMMA2056]WJK38741.1 hypothetical protein O7608_19820 [Solwaraspora sp. WMMA2056]
MSLWIAATWGLVGSIVAEALNLYGMMRPTTESKGRWQWPWRSRRDRPIIVFAVTLRAIAGTGLAAAAAAGGVATTAFATFVFGVVAPLFIAKMFDQVRVVDPTAPPDTLTGRESGDERG